MLSPEHYSQAGSRSGNCSLVRWVSSRTQLKRNTASLRIPAEVGSTRVEVQRERDGAQQAEGGGDGRGGGVRRGAAVKLNGHLVLIAKENT